MTKAGRVYKRFSFNNGDRLIVRTLRQSDLDGLLSFFNGLVDEKRLDAKSQLHSGFDKKLTRREEAKWIRHTIDSIENNQAINIVAEINGKIIANGGVGRGKYSDTRHHGSLGLTLSQGYRGRGIGRRMIQTLVGESRRAGLRSIEVEFLATNKAAERAYKRAGFKKAGIIPRAIFRNREYLDAMIMARRL